MIGEYTSEVLGGVSSNGMILVCAFLCSCAYLQEAFGTMDYIIDTISAVHPLAPLISLLKLNGKLVTVGLPEKPLELPIFPLVLGKTFMADASSIATPNAFSISNSLWSDV